MEGTTLRVLIDEQIPDGALTVTPKLGYLEQTDINWGLKSPPPPQPLGEVSRQPVGVVQVAALKYVKRLIDQEIQRLEGKP